MTNNQKDDIKHDKPIVTLWCAVADYCDLKEWDAEQEENALAAVCALLDKLKLEREKK